MSYISGHVSRNRNISFLFRMYRRIEGHPKGRGLRALWGCQEFSCPFLPRNSVEFVTGACMVRSKFSHLYMQTGRTHTSKISLAVRGFCSLCQYRASPGRSRLCVLFGYSTESRWRLYEISCGSMPLLVIWLCWMTQ